MPKHCILHVGMHKTGSSSIQAALHTKLKLDDEHTYFNLGSANHSIRIFSLFTEKPENYNIHKKRGLNLEEIKLFNIKTKKMLIKEIDACNTDNMIISGEAISILSKKSLMRLKEFMQKYFEKITIIAYVRPPVSFMESSLQQRVKVGQFNEFNINSLYPGYRNRFEKFDIIFGKENVCLWKFDPKIFFKGDVVLDFCHRLNIKINLENIGRSNEAISKEALSLLYTYRKLGPGYGVGPKVIRENAMLINMLKNIGKTKIKLAPRLINPIMKKNHLDLLWIEERMALRFNEYIECTNEDISKESDLLKIDKSSIKTLLKLLKEDSLPLGIKGETPEEVAILVHTLRKQLSVNLKKK